MHTQPRTLRILGDTGCTDFFLRKADAQNAGIPVTQEGGGLVVELPNGATMTAIAGADMRTPDNDINVHAHIFADNDLHHSLGSISALTNAPNSCEVTFTNTGVKVTRAGKTIVRTAKHPTAKLWSIDLPVVPSKPVPTANAAQARCEQMRQWEVEHGHCNLMMRNELAADFVKFVSATFGSPTDHTLLTAVSMGWLGNFPRINAKMIRDNKPNTVATAKGHLDLTRQGQRSTRIDDQSPPVPALPVDDDGAASPNFSDALELGENLHDIYTRVITPSEVLSSDLSGRFPVTSHNGFSYILFSVWRGYIHFELMRSKAAAEYVRAFKATLEFFRARGARPRVQRLDNETSKELKHFFHHDAKVDVEYLPPKNHRSNKAERAIRDGKNHIIATLCTTDPAFPIAAFDELITQAELTLNHLRPCRHLPAVSAWEGLHGRKYDFLAHPIAPSGMRVLVFETPDERGTFAPHGVDGFYLGPVVDAYRCFRCFVTHTNSIRVSDTLAWFPLPYKMPGASVIEQLHDLIKDLAKTFEVISTTDHIQAAHRQPFSEHAATATTALRELAALYSPPGLAQIVAAGAPYPARRAHPPRTIAQPATGAQPPPIQRVGEDGTLAALPPAALPRVATGSEASHHEGTLQRVDNSSTMTPPAPTPPLPQHSVEPSVSTGTAHLPIQAHPVQQQAEHQRTSPTTPDHRLRPNEPIRAPGPDQFPSRPVPHNGAVTRQTTRRNLAAATAFAALPAQRTQATVPRAVATSPPTERSWALNLDPTGQPLKWKSAIRGPESVLWIKALGEEIIRLVRTSETMHAILPNAVPTDRRGDITYFNPQPKEKRGPDGSIVYRVRGACGGDRINFDGPTSAQVADITAVKILINSVVSDKAQWATADIKDFYLGTPLARPEFMRIQLRLLPDSILDELGLRPFISSGTVTFQIDKGMYGLPQAGLLAQDRLVGHLATHGYRQSPTVACLFRHDVRPTAFSLVVDDFGIKFTTKEDLEHFITCMEEVYELKVDRTGSQYLGMTIVFSPDRNDVHLSMPGYIAKAMQRFCPNLKAGASSPAIYVAPRYGAQSQTTVEPDDGPVLPPCGVKLLEEICGVMLYYARLIDSTMLTAVNHIGSEQARPTQRVMDNAMRLLAYAAAYPNNELVLTACDMILYCQSDCSFLTRSEGRSVAGGIEYLGNTGEPTHINGAVHTFSSIIPVVVASIAEGEYGAAYMTGQHATGSRQVLHFLGYPQPPTLIMGDNDCAVGLANNTLKIKRSKSIDMRFHWLRDRIRQGQFEYQWRKGANNLADFFTKALPVHKHLELMPFLVHTPRDPHNIAASKHKKRGQARALSAKSAWRVC